nr:unnamed protein product [Callosobruchus analis]
MLEPSKLTHILKEKILLNIKVLGLCETRWPGSGKKLNSDGSLLVSSGKEENEERIGGVGIILSKIARNILLSWHPVSDRIITRVEAGSYGGILNIEDRWQAVKEEVCQPADEALGYREEKRKKLDYRSDMGLNKTKKREKKVN